VISGGALGDDATMTGSILNSGGAVAEAPGTIQLAPIEDLVSVYPVRSGHTRDRHAPTEIISSTICRFCFTVQRCRLSVVNSRLCRAS